MFLTLLSTYLTNKQADLQQWVLMDDMVLKFWRRLAVEATGKLSNSFQPEWNHDGTKRNLLNDVKLI